MRSIDHDDLSLEFPQPDVALREGPGPALPWSEWMAETAEQTRRFLREHDDPEERWRNHPREPFVLR